MKKIIGIIVIIAISLTLFYGCSDVASVSDKESSYQSQTQSQGVSAVGFPNIANFFEKKTLKNIYELRDQSNLICYAYTQDMAGKYVFVGKCIGFGIPYGTQYTNPDVIPGNYSTGTALPQADPNGLYSSGDTQATWLLLVDDSGKQQVFYSESNVNVYQSKLPVRLCETWSLPTNY